MSHPGSQTGALVGRSDELARLETALGLEAGQPSVTAVLLAGDAGVGKTRLLAELRPRAIAAGWRVVVGHCLNFGDSALPYLPFSEVFGRLVEEAPELAESVVRASPDVARLMPGRRVLAAAAEEPGAERVDRAGLLDAVHVGLTALSQSAPLLVLVEDVHWADQSTREMLSFLFSRQFAAPVAIVASYRTDDLHRRHPLRPLAAEWGRLPGVARLQLDRLPDADVRTLVQNLHPAPLDEREIRGIVARAEGNAFFTEELVAAAERGGRSLPTDLADLLLVRLDQLDDSARQVVRAASVAGRRVSHELLAHVVGLDGSALDQAMRAAVDGNVLVSIGADGYGFRHALLAEAVYDDLLPGERVRLHGAYARALCDGDVEGTAAELARHARAAHMMGTAVSASIRAGDEAMAVGGPDEALHHYEVALELVTEPEAQASDDGAVDVVGLTVKASQAAIAAGHLVRAKGLVRERLDSLPAHAPPAQRALLLHAYVSSALLTETTLDLLALTREAMQLLADEPPTPLLAQVLSVHARANSDRRRDDEAVEWAGKAQALAIELRLPDVVADATTTLAILDERAADPEWSRQTLEKSIAEARAASEVAAELRGLFNLGVLHYELGRLDEARAVYESGAQRARETGRPWAPFGVDARAMAGIVAYTAGDWEAVLRITDVTAENPPPASAAVLGGVALAVAAGRGDRAALDLLPVIRLQWERDGLIAILGGAAAIDLHGDAGDVDAAIAAYDDAVTTVSAVWQRDAFQAQVRLVALLLGQLGSEATRVGADERSKLARRGDELVEVARVAAEIAPRGRPRGPEGEAWVARVAAEQARLRWLTDVDAVAQDDLVNAWEEAVTAFERFGHVFEEARSRARLADVLRAAGRTAEAADEAEQAMGIARKLGAQPLLAELRASFPAGRHGAGAQLDDVLTPREQEVLKLVAQGRSNREIGTQLFISAKTASVHVSNILAKLGVRGRIEAAAVARRRGLLDD
ncbi:MAG: AAA family ATPase [Sporichthyaceae bacterium]